MPIRAAIPTDLSKLIEISLASFGPITWQRAVDRIFGPLNGQDWQARWRRRIEKAAGEQTILVLEEDGAMLGYTGGTLDPALRLAHIDILAIDPSAQGKGHGRRLLSAMEDHFRSQGAAHVTLESLIDNDVANSLYERHGYQRLAQHINWFKKLE